MKITRQYLKQVIKEEIQKINESSGTADISALPQEMSDNNKKFIVKSTSDLENQFAMTKQKSAYSGTNFIDDAKNKGLGTRLVRLVEIIPGYSAGSIYTDFIDNNKQIYPAIHDYLSKNRLH